MHLVPHIVHHVAAVVVVVKTHKSLKQTERQTILYINQWEKTPSIQIYLPTTCRQALKYKQQSSMQNNHANIHILQHIPTTISHLVSRSVHPSVSLSAHTTNIFSWRCQKGNVGFCFTNEVSIARLKYLTLAHTCTYNS